MLRKRICLLLAAAMLCGLLAGCLDPATLRRAIEAFSATPEPTLAPTPEPTIAPTPEPTPEPTPGLTVTPVPTEAGHDCFWDHWDTDHSNLIRIHGASNGVPEASLELDGLFDFYEPMVFMDYPARIGFQFDDTLNVLSKLIITFTTQYDTIEKYHQAYEEIRSKLILDQWFGLPNDSTAYGVTPQCVELEGEAYFERWYFSGLTIRLCLQMRDGQPSLELLALCADPYLNSQTAQRDVFAYFGVEMLELGMDWQTAMDAYPAEPMDTKTGDYAYYYGSGPDAAECITMLSFDDAGQLALIDFSYDFPSFEQAREAFLQQIDDVTSIFGALYGEALYYRSDVEEPPLDQVTPEQVAIDLQSGDVFLYVTWYDGVDMETISMFCTYDAGATWTYGFTLAKRSW